MKKVTNKFEENDKEKMVIMPIEKFLQVNNCKLKHASKWKQYCKMMIEKYPKFDKQSFLLNEI